MGPLLRELTVSYFIYFIYCKVTLEKPSPGETIRSSPPVSSAFSLSSGPAIGEDSASTVGASVCSWCNKWKLTDQRLKLDNEDSRTTVEDKIKERVHIL